MFMNGAALDPVPPVMPVGMGKSLRGVELDDVDARQIVGWMKLVASAGIRTRHNNTTRDEFAFN
jgi:hypothetical protein